MIGQPMAPRPCEMSAMPAMTQAMMPMTQRMETTDLMVCPMLLSFIALSLSCMDFTGILYILNH